MSAVHVVINGVEHQWSVVVTKDELIRAAFPQATHSVLDVTWEAKDGRCGDVEDLLVLEDGMTIDVAYTGSA